jgi:glycine betaine/proline transport system substrate-binding protein
VIKKPVILGVTLFVLLVVLLVGCGGVSTSNNSAPENSNTTGDNVNEAAEETTPVGELFNYEVFGIEPGSGINAATEQAFKDYNLKNWKLKESSGAAMLAMLESAYKNKKPIIITGWDPHWMFSAYDLKYLDDPKGSFGEENKYYTVVRAGFKEDHPNAYKFLSQFSWETEDIQFVMLEAEKSGPEKAAALWIEQNQDHVAKWYEGVEKVDGEEITFVLTAWPEVVAMHEVVAQLLEDIGYIVNLTQADLGPLYAGIASGSADAYLGVYLPAHSNYYDQYKDKYENLGVNLGGAKMGLVVPTYMENINSIEDLAD